MSGILDTTMSQTRNTAQAFLPPGRDYGRVREMSNGRIICRHHGLSTCEMCDVYYGWLDEVLLCDYPYYTKIQLWRQHDANDSYTPSYDEFVDSSGEKDTFQSKMEENDSFAAVDRDPFNSKDALDPFDSEDIFDPFDTAEVKLGMKKSQNSSGAYVDLDVRVTSLERRRGTGQFLPTTFTSPLTNPLDLVREDCQSADSEETRYICRDDNQTVLILVDGSCFHNGRPEARGGWGIIFGPGNNNASGPLEKAGPFGGSFEPTNNRAELRAVIAAIRSNRWEAEGLNNLIIATESLYVVEGATVHVKRWLAGKFKANEDLWRMLLGEVERQHELGVSVQLWHLSKNMEKAVSAAGISRKAARQSSNPTHWID